MVDSGHGRRGTLAKWTPHFNRMKKKQGHDLSWKKTLYIVCFGPYYDQLIQVRSAKNDTLHLLCFEAFFLLCIIPKPIMEIPRFSEKEYFFPPARTGPPVTKDHIFFSFFLFSPGDLYWIGSNKSCSTLIGRHKLAAVNMHVYQPLTKLCSVHLSLCS